MNLKLVGALAAISAVALPAPSRADLVVDGGFNSPGCSGLSGSGVVVAPFTCSGWTFTLAPSGSSFSVNYPYPGNVVGMVTLPAPPLGWVDFGAIGSFDDEISQVLATVPGQSYTVSFQFAANVNSAEDFSAYFGASEIYSEVNSGPPSFTTFTFNVTASDYSTTLAFYGRNVPSGNLLTDVTVDLSGVPGPVAGAGLPGLVFAGGGLVAVWRKRGGLRASRKRLDKNRAPIAVKTTGGLRPYG
jgi:hypothetical protein